MSLDIRYIISPYVEPGTDFDGAIQEIEQLIEQERRAAAEAMRERCATSITNIANESRQSSAPHASGMAIVFDALAENIKALPLDSDGGV